MFRLAANIAAGHVVIKSLGLWTKYLS